MCLREDTEMAMVDTALMVPHHVAKVDGMHPLARMDPGGRKVVAMGKTATFGNLATLNNL
jgi:hypothetical protein